MKTSTARQRTLEMACISSADKSLSKPFDLFPLDSFLMFLNIG
jgi:hypothetical protein